MNILLTGGAGYIGSHVAVELYKSGHTVVIADNLINSSKKVLDRLKTITGVDIPFYEIDVRDRELLDKVFSENKIDAVVHLAGLKAVGESVKKPTEYYDNNINSTLAVLDVMKKFGVKKFVFSSSATVYGVPESLPIYETATVGVGLTNPYGKTKYFIEEILQDASVADSMLEIVILRYFNPIGAHASGLIGESPNDIPNNLMPFITQVAVGKLPVLNVFGDNYDTSDGTGVRDYIHVVDLARGHVVALENTSSGVESYNLGTGKGVSVLELVAAFEKATGKSVPYKIVPPRQGDIAACYASAEKIFDAYGWKAEKTLDDMCADSWRWQSKNPNGYE